MALDENRIKYGVKFSGVLALVARWGKKLFAVLICIILVALLYLSPPDKVKNFTLEYSAKVLDFTSSIYDNLLKPFHFIKNEFYTFNELKTENVSLKLKLQKYEDLETSAKLLESENKELRRLLNVVPDIKYTKKTVRLLSISLNPISKTVLIGAGINDGIFLDQVVVGEKGLLGRVIQLSDNYSKVMLINDSSSRIPIISSLSHERGILNGENYRLSVSYLPDPKSLQEGELLITSGDGKIFPYGIPVAEVIQNDNGIISLKPVAELSNSEFVYIYTNTKKDNVKKDK